MTNHGAFNKKIGLPIMAVPLQQEIHKYLHLKPRKNDETGIVEPEPRSGHRIVADEANLYSIGGYNPHFWDVENTEDTGYPLFLELIKFNFATRKWSKLKCTGSMPRELASHAALMHGKNLLVLGGTGVPFGYAASNQLHVCNLRTFQWKHIDCSGDFPIRVYGHTMTLLGDYLYTFGGTTGWDYNADVHRLSLCTYEWEHLPAEVEKQPNGRYRHEVVCDGKTLYVLGGGRSYAVYKLEEIPTFCLQSRKWSYMQCHPDKKHGYPKARRCHSCVQYDNNAYICGGYNGEEIYGDTWQLSMRTLQWTRLEADMPQPSYFHSAAVSRNGCMTIYGGVTEIDEVRTSNVYQIWLKVPSLKELTWHRLLSAMPNMDCCSQLELLKLGVPQNFLDRLS